MSRDSICVLSPTACLGLMPLSEDSFARGLEMRPDMIGVDGGSLDPGPYYIGAGAPHVARFQAKRELRLMLEACVRQGIPLVIGTAGGSGGLRHIEWNADIIREVAKEDGHRFKMATIPTTVDKDALKAKLATDVIEGCQHDRALTVEDVEVSEEIVAQIGVEPIVEALERGADVVLAGRACDNAVFAALPIAQGFDKGLALHMGKILECGGMCGDPSEGFRSIVATLDRDGFVLEPADPDMRCTVTSVAAHAVYERTNPTMQAEPGGTLDMRACRLEQLSERSVRVEGTLWNPSSEYIVKLEGAQRIGYRSIYIAGARDPTMISHFDEVRKNSLAVIERGLAKEGLRMGVDFHVVIRVYGLDGVMGDLEPIVATNSHELCIILDVVARTQEEARDICYYGKTPLAWANFEDRVTTAGNLAYPFSPSILDVGAVYQLRVHHLMAIDDPREFAIEWEDVAP